MTTTAARTATFGRILDHLHRGGKYAHWWRGDSKSSAWFEVGSRTDCPRWTGNIYFSVHPCTSIPDDKPEQHVKSRLAYIAAINCFYAEFDVGDRYADKIAIRQHLDTLPLLPSVVVDSGGGLQCYWLLHNTFTIDDDNRQHIKSVQYAWVDVVGSDEGAKDLARVLRVPGTLNCKPKYEPDYPTVTIESANLNLTYSLEEFERLTEDLRVELDQRRQQTSTDSGASPIVLSMDDHDLIDRLRRKSLKNERLWMGDTGDFNDDHSRADQALCNELAYYTGKDPERMDRLFRQSGLWRDKWNREDYRTATIDRAIADTPHTYDPNYRSNGYHDEYEAGFAPPTTNGTGPVTKSGNVAFAAELLRMAIDVNHPIDDLKLIIRRLSDDERNTSEITGQLARALPAERDRAKWLASCGHTGDSKAATWLAALRSLPHDFALNQLEDDVEVDGQRLDDVTRSKIYLDMERHGASKTYVDDTINVLASEHTYHPVRCYLESLEWDGQNHLSKLLHHIRGDDRIVTYPNSDKAPLHWLLIRRWLLGCVARALDGDSNNAFKHQTPMLVFIGGQGIGKSSFVRWLVSGIGYEFHQEGPINPSSTEDKRGMVTKWIWEVSELGATLRKADREAMKGFITQEWHTYRKPWGKSLVTKPTLCNLVGTINAETGFLDDPTGHRRFLPVVVTAIDRRYSSTVDINQLWAQLVHDYRNGQSPELSQLEREALQGVYEHHEIDNPLQAYVQMFFDVEPGNEALQCHTATIIQRLREFGIALNNNNRAAGREVNDALAPMGLRQSDDKITIDGVRARGWLGIAPNSKRPQRSGRYDGGLGL